jgi:peptidoglycan/LPS O-acetylase OafA/YrhL
VRSLAALWVVVAHFGTPVAPARPGVVAAVVGAVRHVALAGFLGVNLFFLLSGFILAYTYLAPSGTLRGTRRAFYVARVARIYPPYLAALAVAFLPFLWEHYGLRHDAFIGASSVSLLQGWTLPAGNRWWNGPGWSLSDEAFFYALFPLLAMPLARMRVRPLLGAMAGLWAIGLVAPTVYLLTNPDHLAQRWEFQDVTGLRLLHFTPLFRLPEFLVGVALGCVFIHLRRDQSWSAWWTRHAPLLVVAALVAFVGLLVAGPWRPWLPYVLLVGGLLDPLVAVALLGLAWQRGWVARLLALGPVCALGEASYSLYLLHFPLHAWLARAGLVRSTTITSRHDLIAFLCYVLVAMVLALGMWRYVETPARRAIRRAFAARRPAARTGGLTWEKPGDATSVKRPCRSSAPGAGGLAGPRA